LPLRQSRPSGGRFCYDFKTSELSPEFADQEMARNDSSGANLLQPAPPPQPEQAEPMAKKLELEH
jgi:hypothetical protein